MLYYELYSGQGLQTMVVTFSYDHKKPRSFTPLKKKDPNTCLFFPFPILFWGFGEVWGCRCMRDNIIYGRHETFRCAGGLLLLALSFWRSISQEDVRMIDNIFWMVQSVVLQKYGYCLICVDFTVSQHDAWYLLHMLFAIKRITKLDVFHIH